MLGTATPQGVQTGACPGIQVRSLAQLSHLESPPVGLQKLIEVRTISPKLQSRCQAQHKELLRRVCMTQQVSSEPIGTGIAVFKPHDHTCAVNLVSEMLMHVTVSCR